MQLSIPKLTKATMFLFVLVLFLYPFNTLISKWANITIFSYFKEAFFISITVFSFFSLLLNKRLFFESIDVFVYGYVLMVIINGFLSESPLAVVVHSLRYRLLYLVSTNLYFKYLRMKVGYINDFLQQIILALLISGIIVALLAMVELFAPSIVYSLYEGKLTPHLVTIIKGERYRRFLSTLGNPINLGFYMVLSSGASLYFASTNKAWKRTASIVSCILFLYVALLTYSRGAYVALLCVYLGWFIVIVVKIVINRQVSFKRVMYLVFISISIVAIIYSNVDHPFIVRMRSISANDVVTNTRTKRSLDAFRESKVEDDSYHLLVQTNQSPVNSSYSSNNDIGRTNGAIESDINSEESGIIGQTGIISLMFGHGLGTKGGKSLQYVFEFGYASMLYESGLLSVLLFVGLVLTCMYNLIFRNIVRLNSTDPYLSLFCTVVLGSFMVAMITEDVYMQLPFSLYYTIVLMSTFKLRESD